MKIRWSPEAAADFAEIVEYIHQQNPSAAHRVAHVIYESVTSLESFPIADVPAGSREHANWFCRRFLSSLSTA
jgi:plasmid stabilization system protein ParE